MTTTPDPDRGWHAGPPADAEAIDALAARYPALPAAYLTLLAAEDGSEGNLGVAPGWVALWPAAEVSPLNHAYTVDTRLPGFLGFGSNGGGELLAFDTRATPWRVCMVPFIAMEEARAIVIAADFSSFARQFRRAEPGA